MWVVEGFLKIRPFHSHKQMVSDGEGRVRSTEMWVMLGDELIMQLSME